MSQRKLGLHWPGLNLEGFSLFCTHRKGAFEFWGPWKLCHFSSEIWKPPSSRLPSFIAQRAFMFLPDTGRLHLRSHCLPSAHSCFASATLVCPAMLTHWSPMPPFSPGPAPSWYPFLLSIWLLTCHIDLSIGKSSSLTLYSIYCNS